MSSALAGGRKLAQNVAFMAESPRGSASRFVSLDAWRGLIMVIMALDHVRDFIHAGAMTGSPENLAATTPLLFLGSSVFRHRQASSSVGPRNNPSLDC